MRCFSIPKEFIKSSKKEWAIMDTFDAFSPKFDNPMRINKVRNFFEVMGCKVTFSGLIKYDKGYQEQLLGLQNMKIFISFILSFLITFIILLG